MSDPDTIERSVVALLAQNQKTLVTAESCTGGLVGKRVTDVPGSSAVYLGGWVVYADAMKSKQLGVPLKLIEQHGAVSEPVVRAMAQGAVRNSGADISVAITGVAGPDGGSADKPVGTVWIALGVKGPAASDVHTEAVLFHFQGDRAGVRDLAANSALQMVRFHLLGVPVDTLVSDKHV